MQAYPPTRYMGSKQSFLGEIWDAVKDLPFQTVLDGFSGSGSVGYMFKAAGKSVIANDLLAYAYHTANALIANSHDRLTPADIAALLEENPHREDFIQRTFAGLYFSDEDNRFLDNTAANVHRLATPFKRSLALAALSRACVKRRPRGVFTYVGDRYDDGRRDLTMSLREHFCEAAGLLNEAVFDNGEQNLAYNANIFDLQMDPDLVYLDPPYYTGRSDNDYLRRYHFVEGLCRYWKGVEIQYEKKTRKLKKRPSPFDSRRQVHSAFARLFDQYRRSILVVSYSSSGLPNQEDLYQMLAAVKGRDNVDLRTVDHRYSFGTHHHKVGNSRNLVKEFVFVAV